MDSSLPKASSTGVGGSNSIDKTVLESLGLEDPSARLRVLSDNMPNGIVYQLVSTRDGTSVVFTHVSANVFPILGLTVEEILADSNSFYDRVVLDDAPAFRAKEFESLEKLETFKADFRFRKPSGEVRWLRASSSPRQLSNGWVVWDGFAIDVTDEAVLHERDRFNIEFRTLVAEFSAKFLQVKDWEGFDQAADQCLEALGKMFGVDRCYLFRFSPDLSRIDNTHEWCASGINEERDNQQNLSTAELPWWMERMREMKPLQIPDVNALPLKAAAEKDLFRRQEIQSLICIPISDDTGKLIGFIGFDSVCKTYEWPPEEVNMLKVIADLIGRAIVHVEVIRALEASEALLSQTGMLARIGGWELSADTLEVEWTEQIYRIHELPETGQPPFERAVDFYDPIGRPILENAIKRAFEYGEPYDLELPFTTAKNNRLWVRTKCQPELQDGKVVKLTGIMQDITDQKQNEAERQRLLQAIEQTEDVVIITNIEGDIQYVNPAFERITGYTRSEAIGKNPRLLNSGQQSREFYAELWDTIISGNTWKGTLINKRKDGSLYSEEASISPIKDEQGNVVNFVAVKRDITDELRMIDESRKLQEQFHQAQKLESVGRLAGGVAHDFNNMLSVIIGNIEFALEQCKPGEQAYRDLNDALQAAEQSAELTRQLLAFARKQAIEPRSLDLNESIAKMLKLLRRLIGEDIRLTWQPSAREVVVKMDPVQIDQLLANLCVNARDAISGGGTISISTHYAEIDAASISKFPDALAGEYAVIEVQDTGCGLSGEDLANIFEPFFTTKASQGGTGLGLATVYGIIRQNSGFIDVCSTLGEGTTFRLHIPLDKEEASPTSDVKNDADAAKIRATILLVEDEMAVRKMFVRWLQRAGFETLEAATPAEALQIAADAKADIDLLLTDVILPGMSGRDLAEQITTKRPELKIIYMSGYTADQLDKHDVLKESVRFLSKPFKRSTLLDAVHSALT